MTTRDQIIQTTCSLIERQGYHATGLNEIVKESGAPKGSLYYYFPAGKEEITAEAITWAGQMVACRVRENLEASDDPVEAIRSFVENIAFHVERSGFCAGGPLQTVALETATTSERLNLACREAYSRLQEAFKEKLLAGGFPDPQAGSLATIITASVEGGILLSRTYHSGDPLRQVAGQLNILLSASRPATQNQA